VAHGCLPLKFLLKGAKCYVGSTALAFGFAREYEGERLPSTKYTFGADQLAKYFFMCVADGMPFGEALMKAKSLYYKRYLQNNVVDEVDEKTLLEFVLFGDPTLRV
jgi:hypothetical protein